MEGTSEVLYAVSVAPNKEFEYLNLLAYNVVVRATYPMDFPARCPMPSENVVGQTVTLTPGVCPGVVPPASPVIYYTTDGSFPGSVHRPESNHCPMVRICRQLPRKRGGAWYSSSIVNFNVRIKI